MFANKRLGSILGKLGPLLGLLLIAVVISILNPGFLTAGNLLNVLRQVSINALIAFGMTFVILTGGIDLSVGSTLALSSAVSAMMMANGLDPLLAVLVGLVIGALLGAVNGLVIAKGKVAPFIATLATMTIFRGITLVFLDGRPVSGLSDGGFFDLMGKGYLLGIPIPAVLKIGRAHV